MLCIEFTARDARVKGYLHEDHAELKNHKIRPALVVFPGGAYQYISSREGDDLAFPFFADGYQTFVVTYSVLDKAKGYTPLREAAETMHVIRSHAEQWHIDPARVAIAGFSAGGHLAASLGVLWNEPSLALPADCRPDAMILCYPAITLYEHAAFPFPGELTGDDASVRAMLSLENHVGTHVPPTFIWTTAEDTRVDPENTLMFVDELQRCHVPYESHVFAHGRHGGSTFTQEVNRFDPVNRLWLTLCKNWLNALFDYIP